MSFPASRASALAGRLRPGIQGLRGLAVLLATAALAGPAAAQTAPPELQPAAAAGRLLFHDAPLWRGSPQACVQCHLQPTAQRRGITLDDQTDHIRCAIQGGCGGAQMAVYPLGAMAQFQTLLSGEDMRSLATYIRFPEVAASWPRLEPARPTVAATTLGTRSATTWQLRNLGELPLPVSAVRITGTAASEYRVDSVSCAAAGTVDPRGSCALSISFAPRCASPRRATLEIEPGGPLGPLRVPLSAAGLGQAVPELAASAERLQLGTAAGLAETVSLQLGNACAGSLRITEAVLEGPFTWAEDPAACTSAPLEPEQSCTLKLRRTAAAAPVPAQSGLLRIRHLGMGSELAVPIDALALAGTAPPPPPPPAPPPAVPTSPPTPSPAPASSGGGAAAPAFGLGLLLAAIALGRVRRG
ncbi:MAG: choice-of-anchor D domain-containing protein [Rubrivivax sp.]|nr:choice-of-anchor D domain-containing protein [Rubrivivax sp.]